MLIRALVALTLCTIGYLVMVELKKAKATYAEAVSDVTSTEAEAAQRDIQNELSYLAVEQVEDFTSRVWAEIGGNRE